MCIIKTKEWQQQYYQKNKIKILEQMKSRYEIRKSQICEKNRLKYKLDNNYKKRMMCKSWRRTGVAGDLSEVYDIVQNCTNCQVCGKEFGDTCKKAMDHDHITGEFRQVLCYSCNTRDHWKRV